MKKSGISLVEILVATVIFSLITTSLAFVFISGKKHIMHIKARTQAVELGDFFLSPLQMDVRQDQWATNCLGSNTSCPSANTTIGNITYTPNFTVIPNYSGNITKVNLTINWNETTP